MRIMGKKGRNSCEQTNFGGKIDQLYKGKNFKETQLLYTNTPKCTDKHPSIIKITLVFFINN